MKYLHDYIHAELPLERDQNMPGRVNLDAMIVREDFGRQEGNIESASRINDFRLDYLKETSPIRLQLRKPDFQRETNHWSPEQILKFVSSFVDEEVIPGLILWKSDTFIFVIDGGHRLSALRAWMEDDYGDGAISRAFYTGHNISTEQERTAKRTRKIIEENIGRYSSLLALAGKNPTGTEAEIKMARRANNMFTRSLPLQWVIGSPKVAEDSFYNINRQGTPLDDTEERLIRNRAKPIAIAARAIIRAGSGNKYWSAFTPENQTKIVEISKKLFDLFFKPELNFPQRGIDIPLGGSVSPVEALAWLIDFLTVAGNRNQKNTPDISAYQDDITGDKTYEILKNSLEIANRITGNSAGSLGLHPVVYFYNERGKQSRFLLLGMVYLISDVVSRNDSGWFKKFTSVRALVENFLIENKSLISIMLQNLNKTSRVPKMKEMFKLLINGFCEGINVTPEYIISNLGLTGRYYDIKINQTSPNVSDETKSLIAFRDGIVNAIRCPECKGLLDLEKSISFDHKTRVREGGLGNPENLQRTHPFCNTGVKS